MSRSRRFHAADLRHVAKLSAELALTVRMEPDGSIVLSPSASTTGSTTLEPDTIEEWRRRKNEGKPKGRS
jgi:hypothetical protein